MGNPLCLEDGWGWDQVWCCINLCCVCAEYQPSRAFFFIHTSHESWPTIDIHIVEEIVD